MADAGDGQALLVGGGREECSGATEEDPLQLSFIEFVQQVAAEGNGTAPASGAAGMNILGLLVKDHTAAIGDFSAQI